jgi:hypothetical protein
MLGSSHPANRTSAIPLRNATTRRGAQDDDAKHDPSPGDSQTLIFKSLDIQGFIFKTAKVDSDTNMLPIRSMSRRQVHLR